MAEIIPGIQEATIMDLTASTPAAETEVWGALIQAFDTILQRNVDEPNRQLAELRFLRDGFDRNILQQTCRMLGFDITQDVLDLQTDLTKLTTQLPLYADYNGTDAFEKFIELLLNGDCEVTHLWAQVYKEDLNHYYDWTEEEPTNPADLIYNGGNWIKTTHIDLKMGLLYDSLSLDSIVLKPNQTLFQRVVEIFFDYAPVSLVLRQFWFIIKVRLLLRVGVVIPGAGIKAYARLKQWPPIVIQDGAPVGSWDTNSPQTSSEYVAAKVATLFLGKRYIQAQTKVLDILGFNLVKHALTGLPIAPGAADEELPTLLVRPAIGTFTVQGTKVNVPIGTVSLDLDLSSFEVVLDPTGDITVFAKVCFDALNPVQWPTKAYVLAVIHYSSETLAAVREPSYFIEEFSAAMFSNFRLKINGPILGALEHT